MRVAQSCGNAGEQSTLPPPETKVFRYREVSGLLGARRRHAVTCIEFLYLGVPAELEVLRCAHWQVDHVWGHWLLLPVVQAPVVIRMGICALARNALARVTLA